MVSSISTILLLDWVPCHAEMCEVPLDFDVELKRHLPA